MKIRALLTAFAFFAFLLTANAIGPAANAISLRTLPSGDTMYAIDCDSLTGQLASIDATTAVVTPIGTGTSGSEVDCAAQGAIDQTTGAVYWAAWKGNNFANFFVSDTGSGDADYLGPMTHGNDASGTVGSLMMGPDGTLYALYYYPSGSNWNYAIGTVDKTNGAIAPIADLTLNGAVVSNPTSIQLGKGLWSSAYNQIDQKFYLIINKQDRSNSTLYSVNVSNGVLTDLGLNGSIDTWFGMAFDSQGTMWSIGDMDVKSATISGWTTAGTQERSATATQLNGVDWYSESNVIKWAALPPTPTPPAPIPGVPADSAGQPAELAKTGSLDINLVSIISLLMVAGISAVVLRRRFKREVV